MKTFFTTFTFCLFTFFLGAQNQTPNATMATAGTLTVTFSTNATAKYAMAIYITNSSNALVNTMIYRTSNGDGSAQDMSTFWSKIGSSWSTSPTKLLTNADLDATSGATASSAYSSKTVYWGKTVSLTGVPDGTYTVNLEMANYSPVSRRYTSGTFVKGPAISTVTLSTVTGFTAPVITWTPNFTAVSNTELSTLYSVYPNPTRSTVYVNGFDIDEIELVSINGKSMFVTNQQKLDLNGLPKGIYFAKIMTKSGIVMKKIEKL